MNEIHYNTLSMPSNHHFLTFWRIHETAGSTRYLKLYEVWPRSAVLISWMNQIYEHSGPTALCN
jgi:hypothetical protein